MAYLLLFFAFACSHSPGCKRQAQLSDSQGLLAVLADICVDGAELVSAPAHWTLGLVVHLQQSGNQVARKSHFTTAFT